MGKLALVFPGQGSQSVGMGRELASNYESAAEVYQAAGEQLGWSVADLCFDGPEERLNRTDAAQVALYVNSMAAAAVLRDEGVTGDLTSGHSLGEYSALAAARAFNFSEGLDLVAARGEAMRAAAENRPGSMAAIIGLEDSQVEEVCSEAGEVWPVNYNSPGQLVISGETASVERAVGRAETAGAKKAVMLKVSGAFHSPLMREAAGRMKEELVGVAFAEPEPPCLSPITGEYESPDTIAATLVSQIVSPVRWTAAVRRMVREGADRFVEVGSGKVLSGLIRRIDRDVETMNVSDPKSLERTLEQLQGLG